MRVAILSDTHGNWALAVRSLDLYGGADCVIHLGDTTDDAELIELSLGRKLHIVAGNCDKGGKYPGAITLQMEGKRFFICHGDRFHVKAGIADLYRKAQHEGADIVLYGHTHIPSIEEINGILFINPGSMKMCMKNPTLGILHIEGGVARAEIRDLIELLHPPAF